MTEKTNRSLAPRLRRRKKVRSFEGGDSVSTSPKPTPYRTRPEWIELTKRYVAIFDVLGFRRRLAKAGVLRLAYEYSRLLTIADLWITGRANLFSAEPKTNRMGYVVVSDSIIVWSHRLDLAPSVVHTLGYVTTFFDTCNSLLGSGITQAQYIRAGVAFGDVVLNPSAGLFLGSPFVDAYETEQRQDWIGGLCHHSCESEPNFSSVSGDWRDAVATEIPTHSGRRISGFALNWCRHTPVDGLAQLRKDLEACLEASVRRKMANTLAFWDEMQALDCT